MHVFGIEREIMRQIKRVFHLIYFYTTCYVDHSSIIGPRINAVTVVSDKILTVPDSLKVVRAFELLGMLLLFASLVIAGPTLVLKKYQNARKLTVGLATSSGKLSDQ